MMCHVQVPIYCTNAYVYRRYLWVIAKKIKEGNRTVLLVLPVGRLVYADSVTAQLCTQRKPASLPHICIKAHAPLTKHPPADTSKPDIDNLRFFFTSLLSPIKGVYSLI